MDPSRILIFAPFVKIISPSFWKCCRNICNVIIICLILARKSGEVDLEREGKIRVEKIPFLIIRLLWKGEPRFKRGGGEIYNYTLYIFKSAPPPLFAIIIDKERTNRVCR